MARRWIPVAEVARPHGVRGELRLKLYNEGSELLLRPRAVKLRLADGEEREAQISKARTANKALLVTLSGVDERGQAEALRDARVCVPRDEFPPLAAGEFYACDIEGARVVLADGVQVGQVTGLQSYPTCDVLVVRRDGVVGPGAGPESPPAAPSLLEIPLTQAFIRSVDLDAGIVMITTTEGL